MNYIMTLELHTELLLLEEEVSFGVKMRKT